MCTQTAASIEFCDEPLYATQGGGYATQIGGRYVWHSEIPEGENVGDEIPDKWSVVAINHAAHRQSDMDDMLAQGDDYYWD